MAAPSGPFEAAERLKNHLDVNGSDDPARSGFAVLNYRYGGGKGVVSAPLD